MSSAMLAPLFNILTGLSFLLVLAVGLGARTAIKGLSGRLAAFAILLAAAGFFFLAQGTARTLTAGAEMVAAAGGCFFAAALLTAVSIFIRARRPDA